MANTKRLGYVTAIALALGVARLATPATAADITTIGEYGYWTATSSIQSGEPVCGVRTSMNRGGELRLEVSPHGVDLVATDPSWHLQGDSTRIALSVDGEVFRGRADIQDARTLRVEGLTWDFVQQFMAGNTLVAAFPGDRWTVDLSGSTLATVAMANCREARMTTISG